MLRAGQRLELTVEKGVFRGRGLARHQGQVVFVPRGLPGDRLRVRITAVTRGYAEAVLEAVLAPAPSRRASPCPYVPRCGGCAYQELDYAGQLELKAGVLRESLERGGVKWDGPLAVVASPETAWRTRASFHVDARSEPLVLGLRQEQSRRVVDVEHCLQVSTGTNAALGVLRRALATEPALARRVRDVDVAESRDGAERVAALEAELGAEEATRLGARVRDSPWLSGVGLVEGSRGRRRYLPLHGEPYVHHHVGGFRLRAHVLSFFQANRFLVDELVGHVTGLIPQGGTVLDLYAGVGLFALALGARAERVAGAELNPWAVEDARANVAGAAMDHVGIEALDVLDALESWPAAASECVVLDPPRTGAPREVIEALARRRPAVVVYVSCDPPTLGRDLRQLHGLGYRLDALRGFDLFPDTFHLEAVARLLPG